MGGFGLLASLGGFGIHLFLGHLGHGIRECYKLVLSDIVREAKWIIRIVCYGPPLLSLLRGLLAVYLRCLSTSLSNQKILCSEKSGRVQSTRERPFIRPRTSHPLWLINTGTAGLKYCVRRALSSIYRC
jgi:hypothetical protein